MGFGREPGVLNENDSKITAMNYAFRLIPFYTVSLAALLVLSGCPSSTNDGPSTVDPADGEVENFANDYRGKIDGQYNIAMHLENNSGQLVGTYHYTSVGSDLALEGTLDGENLELAEYDAAGNQTGWFRGKLTGTDQINGTWTKADGSNPLPFELFLASEEAAASPVSDLITTYYIHQVLDDDGYYESYSFPQVSGMANKSKEAELNDMLNIADVSLDELDEFEYEPGGPEDVGGIFSDCRLLYIDDEIVSYEIAYDWWGGAHPDHSIETTLLSAATLEPISLADMFEGDYKEELSSYFHSDEILATYESDGMVDDYRCADLLDAMLEDWSKTDDSELMGIDNGHLMLIGADNREYGCSYAEHNYIDVLVPLSEIKSLIRSDGPLANAEENSIAYTEYCLH